MIKDEFSNRYRCCKISAPSDYSLENISNPAVFSVDKVFERTKGASGPRCDEFVFSALDRITTGVVLVERKTASSNISKIKHQLQGGANFIAKFWRKDFALDAYELEFKPILVSQEMKASVFKKLTSKKIFLRGKPRRINHVITNEKLPRF